LLKASSAKLNSIKERESEEVPLQAVVINCASQTFTAPSIMQVTETEDFL
jgi:hypothetical protein